MHQQLEERVEVERTQPAGGGGEPDQPSRVRRWLGGRGNGTGLTATGASIVLAIVVGLGLFAVVSNTVLSQGNSTESGTYAYEPPPGPVELEVALVDPAAPADACDTATYDASVVPAILTATADLDAGTIGPVTTDVCVRTAGTFDAYLRVTNTNLLDIELGACEPTESSAGLDTTCLDGEQGELAAVVEYALEDDSLTCPAVQSNPSSTVSYGPGMIAAGTTCRYAVRPQVWPQAWDETLAAAQTDRATWDIGFELIDDPYEPNDDTSAYSYVEASSTVSATINPETDQDWWAFSHFGGTLVAETTGPCDPTTGDTVLTLYEVDGTTVVTFDDDGGTGNCSLISTAVPAGDYYVVVESYANSLFVSRYDLTVTSTP